MGNIRVKNTYTPDISAPFVPQPYIPESTGAVLFDAIRSVGTALTAYGKKIEADKAASQDFLINKQFIDEATAAQSLTKDLENAAGPDAPQYAAKTDAFFKQRHDQLLSQLQAGGATQDQINAMDLKLTTLRQQINARALTFEENSHKAYVGGVVDDAGKKFSQLVFADPAALQLTLAELKDTIDKLPNLSAPERQTMYEEQAKQLGLMAGLGFAEIDPQGVVDALTPGKRTYGATTEVSNAINAAFTSRGLPPQWGFDIAKIESDVGRNQRPTGAGNNTGLFQLSADLMPAGTDPYDVKANAAAAADNLARAATQFKSKTGRAPTEAELYLMHQQGTAGGLALATADPNRPAWEVIKPFYPGKSDAYIKTAISQQGLLSPDATVAEVKAFWERKLPSTGNFALDNLDAADQYRVLNAAQSNVNKIQVDLKSTLDRDVTNAKAGFETGTAYDGPAITRDRFLNAGYSPVETEQRFKEYQDAEQVGKVIGEIATLPPAEAQARVDALKPVPGTSTYAVDADSYAAAVKAQGVLRKQQETDPVAYAMHYFPSVQTAAKGLVPGASLDAKQQYYNSLNQAYNQIGLLPEQRKPFTPAMLDQMKSGWASMDPEAKVASLVSLSKETGPLFDQALNQLLGDGHEKEAYIADAVATDPSLVRVMADALRGLALVDPKTGSPALKPTPELVDAKFREIYGAALYEIEGPVLRAMEELTTGLYVMKGGKPGKSADSVGLGAALDDPVFESAARRIVGGTTDPDSGWWDNGKGHGATILPPGNTGTEFRKMMENAQGDFYSRHGNGLPYYENGAEATPDRIESEGTFLRVNSDQFKVVMNDGLPLQTAQGNLFLVTLNTDTVRQESLAPSAPLMFPSAETPQKAIENLKNYNLSSPSFDRSLWNEEEQHLYEHHLKELQNGGVKNSDGSISTVRQITVEIDGNYYSIPTVWDGKILSTDASIARAKKEGLDKWPAYATEENAQARYNQMHTYMEEDLARYKKVSP